MWPQKNLAAVFREYHVHKVVNNKALSRPTTDNTEFGIAPTTLKLISWYSIRRRKTFGMLECTIYTSKIKNIYFFYNKFFVVSYILYNPKLMWKRMRMSKCVKD